MRVRFWERGFDRNTRAGNEHFGGNTSSSG